MGGEVGVSEIMNYFVMNVWVVEKFFGNVFEVEGEVGKLGILRVVKLVL